MNTFNHTVLMSGADYFDNTQQINPYYHDEPVSTNQAQQEHDAIRQAIEAIGTKVVRVDPPPDSQDGVYAANWALVRGDTAVLARLPNARKAEEPYAETVLRQLGKTVIHVPDNLRFSGQGDALPCGKFLFCGQGYRSDIAAQTFAAEQLGFERIQLQTIPQLDDAGRPVINQASGWPDSFYYDIDLALSIIKPPTDTEKGLIAYCPDAFTKESQVILEKFEAVEKIIVSETEAKTAFACNLISNGESVVMGAHAPELQHKLETHGLQVETPEISELVKGGGYIRCTSLTVD